MTSEPDEDRTVALARRLAGLVIGLILGAFAVGLVLLGIEVRVALRDWEAYKAQVGVAQASYEEPICDLHPVLGWKAVAGRTADLSGALGPGVVWSINANGLRADRDYPPEPPPGVTRILALGDSFTFGNTRLEDTWPAQLEAMLEDVEVLNMGQSGYGVDQLYLWFAEDGPGLHPDLVVEALIDGDLLRARMTRWQTGYRRPRFELVDGALELVELPGTTRAAPGQPLAHVPSFPTFLATHLLRGVEAPSDRVDDDVHTVPGRLVAETAKIAADLGAGFALVRLPTRGDRPSAAPCGRTLCRIAEDAGGPYLDAFDAFLAAEDDGPPIDGPWFLPDQHYDAAGNRIAAAAIADLLVTRFGLRRRASGPAR